GAALAERSGRGDRRHRRLARLRRDEPAILVRYRRAAGPPGAHLPPVHRLGPRARRRLHPIDSRGGRPAPMTDAIATVVIGTTYRQAYERIFRPSVQLYAARHGYELLLLDDYSGDEAFRAPDFISFMKMLLPYHPAAQHFHRLMVLDADILIHPE